MDSQMNQFPAPVSSDPGPNVTVVDLPNDANSANTPVSAAVGLTTMELEIFRRAYYDTIYSLLVNPTLPLETFSKIIIHGHLQARGQRLPLAKMTLTWGLGQGDIRFCVVIDGVILDPNASMDDGDATSDKIDGDQADPVGVDPNASNNENENMGEDVVDPEADLVENIVVDESAVNNPVDESTVNNPADKSAVNIPVDEIAVNNPVDSSAVDNPVDSSDVNNQVDPDCGENIDEPESNASSIWTESLNANAASNDMKYSDANMTATSHDMTQVESVNMSDEREKALDVAINSSPCKDEKMVNVADTKASTDPHKALSPSKARRLRLRKLQLEMKDVVYEDLIQHVAATSKGKGNQGTTDAKTKTKTNAASHENVKPASSNGTLFKLNRLRKFSNVAKNSMEDSQDQKKNEGVCEDGTPIKIDHAPVVIDMNEATDTVNEKPTNIETCHDEPSFKIDPATLKTYGIQEDSDVEMNLASDANDMTLEVKEVNCIPFGEPSTSFKVKRLTLTERKAVAGNEMDAPVAVKKNPGTEGGENSAHPKRDSSNYKKHYFSF